MKKLPEILQKIINTKQKEIIEINNKFEGYKRRAFELPKGKNFKKALLNNAIIAEVKKASPSAGIICEDFKPVQIALDYEKSKADAISVLTDKVYFKGDISYLIEIKKSVDIPVLRKDFIISEIQIYESKIAKADSFLLIARILTESQLNEYVLIARSLNIEPLVEIHDMEDLEKALSADASIIGINNRDLNNFTVNADNTFTLKEYIPEEKIIVGESGINSVSSARKLLSDGCNALLIGEFLMRSQDKSFLIKEIKKNN
ncbi:MAG TPA: indole-3-glycerol phosphate synthase TrpC [Victivallales bacterium]|nr:indole-3-glycerol phosphate synthase TrpC [Victivallales bacterium]